MSEGGGDDGGNGEEDDSMTITTGDIERDIVAIDKEIQEMSDGACGSIYQCTTCYKLSKDHPNGIVKHCKSKKSELEEYANSLVNQLRASRSSFRFSTF